jgi:large subunit ribosomal protein L14
MASQETLFDVADNTGAKKVLLIRRLGQCTDRVKVGDIVVVTVKEGDPQGMIKKGQKSKGVVVRLKEPLHRDDGSYIKFDTNAVVLLDNNMNPRVSRIFGTLPRELRGKNFSKILSLAPEVL